MFMGFWFSGSYMYVLLIQLCGSMSVTTSIALLSAEERGWKNMVGMRIAASITAVA